MATIDVKYIHADTPISNGLMTKRSAYFAFDQSATKARRRYSGFAFQKPELLRKFANRLLRLAEALEKSIADADAEDAAEKSGGGG